MSCRITDLDTVFSARLVGGRLEGITFSSAREEVPPAQIRLAMSSDDLVALTGGQLELGKAWLSGRVKVEASISDLMRMRRLS